MVTNTANKPVDYGRLDASLVAFDDYLRFGTDEERPKSDTTRHAYLWTADLFNRFLNGRELSPELLLTASTSWRRHPAH